MNILNKIFRFNKRKKHRKDKIYTDEELLDIGKNLRNKILILRMNNTPYNKIIISSDPKIMHINDIQYIELTANNLNRQLLSVVIPIKTYIKLCNMGTIFKQSSEDVIYLKEIKNDEW